MQRWIPTLPLVLLVAVLTTVVYYRGPLKSKSAVEARLLVSDILATADTVGFARVTEPRTFVFPKDLGPHPDFKTEWWYVTGNLMTSGGRQFGFQLTFFRSAVTPEKRQGRSAWHANQIYMAHFAISDIANQGFHYFERLSRGAVGLAGAETSPFRVWLDDWSLRAVGDTVARQLPELHLRAEEAEVALSLRMVSMKRPVLQGKDGLSQKGPEIGNASYYYSLSRLRSDGEIRIGDALFPVTGWAWLDREWSTSALGPQQVGWDWFALQLADSTEIMFYQIRDAQGQPGPYSGGVLIDASGKKIGLHGNDIDLVVLDWWKSPRGGTYPAKWRLRIPMLGFDLDISPQLDDQELDLSLRYWEGAVEVKGRSARGSAVGQGYAELTGYAQ